MLAFQLIAAFLLTWFLLMIDHEHTILSDPAGYAQYSSVRTVASGIE